MLNDRFRFGGEISEIATSIDFLCAELHRRNFCLGMIDDEFSSILLIKRACFLLGPELIRVEKLDHQFIQPNISYPKVLELGYYSNGLRSVLALDSAVAIAILESNLESNLKSNLESNAMKSNGKTLAKAEGEIIGLSTKICKLLALEFLFVRPLANVQEEIHQRVMDFKSRGIIEAFVEGDTKWNESSPASDPFVLYKVKNFLFSNLFYIN